MAEISTKLVLEELEGTQIECDNCAKSGHRFDRILVISRNGQIRNAKYCICCGEILN
ncbi:MAG: hypothetical protein O2U61_03590 [Candidatus Bathyarchaeota archaeon]|nr:hypothetical protein [Candidatus Bathyarchaeota archaeon]MCZ2845569.1 hypothetical protein [Candidatus Bathyarchaeota archaeon]